MKKRIKINGIIIFLIVMIIVLFPKLFFRQRLPAAVSAVTAGLGIALVLLGQMIRISARGYKAENSQGGHFLVKSGPYALVRNPMYLGILLIGLGIVLIFFKAWVVATFLFFFILRYLLLIFQEEKKLITVFPEEYKDYQNKVPRLFPQLKMIFSRETSTYLPLKWSWVGREKNSVLPVLFFTLLVQLGLDIRSGGLSFYLKEAVLISLIILVFILFAAYLNRKTNAVK
ncbi:MAG: isoprenylcysteine carboxylmethyltransferase family protein [Candidatus Omnitrophica bacterium]|nr:isoprenylcysteine carboxylmethyltransferase family protein [Candidatus Omnitrophota bacterium]MDD5611093.1 isoprenylcysteine carboxylmethyltransferase family protein [Candidatus Omnitrophota bacterium]